ncbi:F-box associated domain-containing protein [Caenorhabditis elegans]|uniref:F-box associated domain-containing protein n=1 Tax=Caenorhabditis elegans TaxID=6239 RepID=Q86S48_CAEEL|nr:F-box associated domain-containing protein [Caenorhabditis elegans]CCD62001.2 F-box associated domain-containing protein [Caenorhabditis elegans]|eukprot:NP_872062.2 SKN-1 Dependent Zygotic transcript [Caenorhabditis elegans]
MNAGGLSIPVFRLPEKPRKIVIHELTNIAKLSFSFCSRKTHEIIRSLRVRINKFELRIYTDAYIVININYNNIRTSIRILLHSFCKNHTRIRSDKLDKLEVDDLAWRTFKIRYHSFQWNNSGLTLKDLIGNLYSLAHMKMIDVSYRVGDSYPFDFEALRKTFDVVPIRRLNLTQFIELDGAIFWNCRHVDKIVNVFWPSTKVIDCDINLFDNSKCTHQILARNLYRIEHRIVFDVGVNYSLLMNRLLVSNLTHLSLNVISVKELNLFLKHWANGSNPQMDFLTVDVDEQNVTYTRVLSGISYTNVSAQNILKFKHMPDNNKNYVNMEDFDVFEGGMNIKRIDGTVATICIKKCYALKNNIFLKVLRQEGVFIIE